ncbi:MAG TPA: hypothetical protein VK272_04585 [Solirubrobacteraceae bacterium]|nr:hypothetical protein [Solirubrobacteraceae bacterium]
MATNADEVGVGAAASFGVADDQSAAALAAVDAPAQVVGVLALLLAGEVLGGQELLNLVPRLRRHKRLVLAGVDRASVAHHPHVVGVAQQRVQMRDDQRLARGVGAGRGRQSSAGQLGQQAADRPVASRIRLERPAHQRPAHRVDLDGAGFAAVDDLADVQVADRRASRRAAVLGLLHAALDDLRGEVARVELGNRGHDAVQQQTRRCLVDVLADGYQLGPGLRERQVDRHVIGSIARQPIDLVDDDVLDGMLGDVGEHPLKFGTVGGLGRLAALHELSYDGGAQAGGLTLAALPLRRNGEALGFAALLGLLLAGNPEVDHGRGSLRGVRLVHCHTYLLSSDANSVKAPTTPSSNGPKAPWSIFPSTDTTVAPACSIA